MQRRSKHSLPKSSSAVRRKIAHTLHDGLAQNIDSIAADLAEVIGRKGLTPGARTKLRSIAARQNQLAIQLREQILLLQDASPEDVAQVLKIRELQPLTKKEMEILQLLGRALSADEISKELFVTIATVKSHIAAIYRKLGVKNRTAALKRARDAGILNL